MTERVVFATLTLSDGARLRGVNPKAACIVQRLLGEAHKLQLEGLSAWDTSDWSVHEGDDGVVSFVVETLIREA